MGWNGRYSLMVMSGLLFGRYEPFCNTTLLSRVTVIVLVLLGSSFAHAGESIWLHNGSTIRWVSNGTSRRAYYAEPRAGLDKIGVHPGQLLFEGYRRGDIVTGRAYTFKPRCPPLSFSVSANLLSETTIDLRGIAPRRDLGCDVTSFVKTDLRFEHLPTTGESPPIYAPPEGGPGPSPPSTDTPEACKKFPLLCN
jgi:hypothetical protein